MSGRPRLCEDPDCERVMAYAFKVDVTMNVNDR